MIVAFRVIESFPSARASSQAANRFLRRLHLQAPLSLHHAVVLLLRRPPQWGAAEIRTLPAGHSAARQFMPECTVNIAPTVTALAFRQSAQSVA